MPAGGGVGRLAELGAQVEQLLHQRAHRPRRRRFQANAERRKQSQEDAPRGLVTLDLPAVDVPPIGSHGRGQLLARQPGLLPELTEPPGQPTA